jgi:hypothetical protein
MALSSDARLLGATAFRFKSNSLHRIAMFEGSRAALAHGHSPASIRVALATLDTFLRFRERMKLNVPAHAISVPKKVNSQSPPVARSKSPEGSLLE